MIKTGQATIPVVQMGGDFVEVQLEISGSHRTIRGNGVYVDNDPDLGQVFKISVSDPQGDFEILLPPVTVRNSFWQVQAVGNEIAGVTRGAKDHVQLSRIHLQNAGRSKHRLRMHVVIGPGDRLLSAGDAVAEKLADLHVDLGIDSFSHWQPPMNSPSAHYGHCSYQAGNHGSCSPRRAWAKLGKR